MKAVMLSIKPQWCEKIISGKKTIEVRKTRPKLETPFKCYIYCTKEHDAHDLLEFHEEGKIVKLNKNVIGEFVCDKVFPIQVLENGGITDYNYNALWDSCIQYTEISNYIGAGKIGYGLHISKFEIYEKPREAQGYYYPPETYCDKGLCGGCPYDQVMGQDGDYAFDCEWKRPIMRPPQSWCYVGGYDERRDGVRLIDAAWEMAMARRESNRADIENRLLYGV